MVRKIKNWGHLLQAILANLAYGFPSRRLIVIGITGTDGKTTTTHLTHQILKQAGKKAELISTVSSPGLHVTTPSSWILQSLLRKMVKQKVEYLVLEATSHGLDQHRLWGIKFQIGVITNVTHEHLDYHRTYQRYLEAKSKLFKGVKTAVLNVDDSSFAYLKKKLNPRAKLVTYSLNKKADFTPKSFPFETQLPGDYNRFNCLAAIATTKSLGISTQQIRQGVASFKGVIGRREKIIEVGQDFQAIVDFAHTPNGLESVLMTLKKEVKKPGRLIVVFGCAGLRDKQKRPLMGEIAGRLADLIVLTAEDPRSEDVNQIIEQIAQGVEQAGGVEDKTYFRVPDRRQAVARAVKLAKKGDIVVFCGKGHERSLCIGKTEHPWHEQEEVRQAIKKVNV